MPLSKTFAVGLCALSLAACENMSDRETTGTVVGGVLGGVVGNQVNRHGDQGLSTVLGVALGGFIGNRIGHEMDKRDVAEHDRAARAALADQRSGYPSAWQGSASSGQFYSRDTYRDANGRTCRPFSDTVTFRDGYRRTVDGVACLNRDGQWVVVG